MIEYKVNNLITEDEHEYLSTAERHETSYLFSYKDKRKCKIVVDIDAKAIASLAEMAFHGCRVYEFMSIKRPGDLLHYLWVTLIDLDDALIKSIKESVDYKYPYEFDIKQTWTSLPFIYFDECFYLQKDDTALANAAWREHIDNEFWYQKLASLYQLISKLQLRLRNVDNFLLQYEIKLADERKHRRDYFKEVERNCSRGLTDFKIDVDTSNFNKTLVKLIAQDDVQSVSCPFGDVNIWRILVEEQIRRSQKLGLPLQKAFALYGPDEGLNDLPEDWGGYLHVPFEGMCDADVVFLPNWRVFHIEKADSTCRLAKAISMENCRYLFVPNKRDLGEFACASRKNIGNWMLYCQKSDIQ